MTSRELFELAHLDALGLLDETDRVSYDRAFRNAPAALRMQLRTEQERVAISPPLLPNEEPSSELRERVLETVSLAMLESESFDVSGGRGAFAGANGPTTNGRERVSWAWRAGAIGLLSCVVLLGAAFTYVLQRNNDMNVALQNDRLLTNLLASTGNGYMQDMLFDASTRQVQFTSLDPSKPGRASLLTNDKWSKSRFFCERVSSVPGQTVRVVELNADGTVGRQLDEFRSDGSLTTREISSKLEPGMRLAVIVAREGVASAAKDIVLQVTV